MICKSNSLIKVTRLKTDNVLAYFILWKIKEDLSIRGEYKTLKFSFTYRKDHLTVSSHTRSHTIVDMRYVKLSVQLGMAV